MEHPRRGLPPAPKKHFTDFLIRALMLTWVSIEPYNKLAIVLLLLLFQVYSSSAYLDYPINGSTQELLIGS